MRETPLQKRFMMRISKRKHIRIFRNNVGMGFVGTVIHRAVSFITLKNYRPIQFGLFVGSGDLIGIKTILITPEMVGLKIGQFLSIETKTLTGRVTDKQLHWRDQILSRGGAAYIVNRVEQADEI